MWIIALALALAACVIVHYLTKRYFLAKSDVKNFNSLKAQVGQHRATLDAIYDALGEHNKHFHGRAFKEIERHKGETLDPRLCVIPANYWGVEAARSQDGPAGLGWVTEKPYKVSPGRPVSGFRPQPQQTETFVVPDDARWAPQADRPVPPAAPKVEQPPVAPPFPEV